MVFATDPIGQGEREQSYDPRVGHALGGWSVPEHIQAGAQAILIGESVARFFIWDAKRGSTTWSAGRMWTPRVSARRDARAGAR